MADQYLNQNQELRQEQTLAPQQIQSLEVLLTPLLELQEKLNQELERNPVIEQVKISKEPLPGEPAFLKGGSQEDTFPEGDDDKNFSDLVSMAESWHQFQPPAHSSSDYTEEDEEKRDFMFNSLIKQPSLQEQMLEQLRLSDADSRTAVIAEIIIGSIDETGYLRTPVSDLVSAANADMTQVSKALTLVQSFDPPGIGARDLKECLLLQLERQKNQDKRLHRLIKDYLEDIGKNRLPQIAKAMRISLEEVTALVAKIKDLNPYPGSAISPEDTVFVIPELAVEKVNGEFQITLNDEQMPHFRISRMYLNLLEDPSTNKETRDYIREKILSGKMLIRSLEQRQSTIQRIAQVIVDTQHDFLEKGIEYMRPLTMQQVADKLGLHETTISRAIANKYIQTPSGLFEFKFFFSCGYQTEEGEVLSSKSIKEKIRDLILGEDTGKPLSDSKISDLLKKAGLSVARRTVAKYREEMDIPPSNLRKEYK
ncbi:MAG: RNA polymerase factor sigma-54 [Victivallaceae bacterium]